VHLDARLHAVKIEEEKQKTDTPSRYLDHQFGFALTFLSVFHVQEDVHLAEEEASTTRDGDADTIMPWPQSGRGNMTRHDIVETVRRLPTHDPHSRLRGPTYPLDTDSHNIDKHSKKAGGAIGLQEMAPPTPPSLHCLQSPNKIETGIQLTASLATVVVSYKRQQAASHPSSDFCKTRHR
jgi:hypothetical protein